MADWVNVDVVVGAVDALARETQWGGVEVPAFPPGLPATLSCTALEPGSESGLDAVLITMRGLPWKYSAQLDQVSRAVLQVVVDVQHADGPPVTDGSGVSA